MDKTPSSLLATWDMITRPKTPRLESLGIAQATHINRTRDIFEDKNIIGVGISEKITDKKDTGALSLCFYVEKKLAKSKVAAKNAIPPVMSSPDGKAIFTDVKEIGRLLPQANVRRKPIKSGYSVGHIGTTGTLGAIVKMGGKYHILSNAHVLALSGTAKLGDQIVFPGADVDHGALPGDLVATLTKFAPLVAGGNLVNRADAALAQIVQGRVADIDFEIYGAKKALDIVEPARDMTVIKRGRTSGDTESVIRDAHFSFVIPYDELGEVGFIEQVLCDRYTSPGDSGSVVVEKKSGKIVGLHFAGDPKGSVFNPISAVIKALGFTFTSA